MYLVGFIIRRDLNIVCTVHDVILNLTKCSCTKKENQLIHGFRPTCFGALPGRHHQGILFFNTISASELVQYVKHRRPFSIKTQKTTS